MDLMKKIEKHLNEAKVDSQGDLKFETCGGGFSASRIAINDRGKEEITVKFGTFSSSNSPLWVFKEVGPMDDDAKEQEADDILNIALRTAVNAFDATLKKEMKKMGWTLKG